MRVYTEAELTEPRSTQQLLQERQEICAIGSIFRLECLQQPDHRLTSKPSLVHQEQDRGSSSFPTLFVYPSHDLGVDRPRYRSDRTETAQSGRSGSCVFRRGRQGGRRRQAGRTRRQKVE